jgi:PAS domain S-box-containing protein
MKHHQTSRFWHAAAPSVVGSIAVALLTFVCFRLDVDPVTAAFLYLIVIVLVSLRGSFVPSAVVSIIAICCLDYFFTPPLFQIRLSQPLDVVALITFWPTALIITHLISKVRESFQDIQALKDQQRLVIDTVPGLVWTALPDGSRDFLNQRWLEYTGLSLEEGLGWSWQAAFQSDDLAGCDAKWRAAVAAGAPFEHEVRMRRADGEYRWFWIRGVPLRDELGTIVKWYGTSTDVEDRKRAEEAVREQANLLNLTHDTVFVRDMNDVITYWNRGAEELYGWTREEAVGKVTHQLMRTIFPVPLEEVNAELLHTGRWEGELIHTKSDGTQVVVASRWSLQRDEQGRPTAILETNNDITERQRAEDALRKAQTELAHGAPEQGAAENRPGGRFSPRAGRSHPAAAGAPESIDQRHRSHAGGDGPVAGVNHPVAERGDRCHMRRCARRRRRHRPAGHAPDLHRLLYDETRRAGHGIGDQPFDYRGARRAAVGLS